jgi:hypothetical protein
MFTHPDIARRLAREMDRARSSAVAEGRRVRYARRTQVSFRGRARALLVKAVRTAGQIIDICRSRRRVPGGSAAR